MRIGTTPVVVGLTIALAGCGGSHAKPHAAAAPDKVVANGSAVTPPLPVKARDAEDNKNKVQPPIAPPRCPGSTPAVHFDTPEAAMTYLASAWNRNDLNALCQVTNPNARFVLNDMHREAVNLRLIKCKYWGVGQYLCTFRHDYPKKMHKSGTGRAYLDVGAADNPGYYMTVFAGCG